MTGLCVTKKGGWKVKGLLVRWLLLTLAIILTSYLGIGIYVRSFFSAFFAAMVLGVLNALFRPILILITLPINILTLGLFTFVINAVLLLMVSGLVPGFYVYGFWAALFGSLVISLVSWLLSSFVNEKGRIGYIDLKKSNRGIWE
jgi:putative membrane protein